MLAGVTNGSRGCAWLLGQRSGVLGALNLGLGGLRMVDQQFS